MSDREMCSSDGGEEGATVVSSDDSIWEPTRGAMRIIKASRPKVITMRAAEKEADTNTVSSYLRRGAGLPIKSPELTPWARHDCVSVATRMVMCLVLIGETYILEMRLGVGRVLLNLGKPR